MVEDDSEGEGALGDQDSFEEDDEFDQH